MFLQRSRVGQIAHSGCEARAVRTGDARCGKARLEDPSARPSHRSDPASAAPAGWPHERSASPPARADSSVRRRRTPPGSKVIIEGGSIGCAVLLVLGAENVSPRAFAVIAADPAGGRRLRFPRERPAIRRLISSGRGSGSCLTGNQGGDEPGARAPNRLRSSRPATLQPER